MQPNQQQTPADWQQPAESPAVTPYQPLTPAASVQPTVEPSVPSVAQEPTQASVAQPPAPTVAPSPLGATPAQAFSPTPAPSPVPQTVQPGTIPAESVPEQINPAPTQSEVASDTAEEVPLDDNVVLLRWQGTEYTHDARSIKWYIIFGLVAVIAVALAIIVLKSITFAILIPVMVAALLFYVRRPPEVLNYILSRKGLHINDKLFSFDQFKAFGIVTFNGAHSVTLVPRKRFQISQTIYFPEEVGEQLVDMLAERLPMKEIQPDAIDKLLAKLHL